MTRSAKPMTDRARQRGAAAACGFLGALFVLGTAVADDTELLLLNPTAPVASKPNILFVLDTSGSMSTTVTPTTTPPATPAPAIPMPCTGRTLTSYPTAQAARTPSWSRRSCARRPTHSSGISAATRIRWCSIAAAVSGRSAGRRWPPAIRMPPWSARRIPACTAMGATSTSGRQAEPTCPIRSRRNRARNWPGVARHATSATRSITATT